MRQIRYVLSRLAIGVLAWSAGISACSCGEARASNGVTNGTPSGSIAIAQGEERSVRKPIIIDTRSKQEYAAGHLDGALLMPHDVIGSLIEAQVPDKGTPVLLYCRGGGRAEAARKTLTSMNYTHVKNLGGMQSAADTLKKEVVK